MDALDTEDWVECIDEIRDICSKEFHLGEIVHCPTFTLEGALNALELMVPKMDGLMNKHEIMTIEKALRIAEDNKKNNIEVKRGLFTGKEKKFAVQSVLEEGLKTELCDTEVIGIMDQLLACEATWHTGQSIGHTLFTCLYLHENLKYIQNPILLYFSQSLLVTCSFIFNCVLSAAIYEEEDFVNNTYGFSMCENISVEQCELLANDLVSVLTNQIENINDPNRVKLIQTEENEVELCKSMIYRINYRKSMLSAHAYLLKKEYTDPVILNELLTTAQKSLNRIRDTLKYGTSPAPGFDDSITRLLAPSSPPQLMRICSRRQSIDMLYATIDQMLYICEIDNSIGIDNILNKTSIFAQFQGNIVSRSHLLCSLGTSDLNDFLRQGPLKELIFKSQIDFCISSDPSCYTGNEIPSKLRALIDLFNDRVSQPILLLLKSSCESKARHYDKVPIYMQDWMILQDESIVVDQHIKAYLDRSGINNNDINPYQFPFFSWIYEKVCEIIINYLLTGFELKLYSNAEAPYIYWYLSFLCDTRVKNQQMAYRPPLKQKTIKTMKTKRKNNNTKETETQEEYKKLITCSDMYNDALGLMARGIGRVIQGSSIIPFIKVPDISCDFDDEYRQNWFNNRFHMFHQLSQPKPLTLSDYDATTNMLKKYAESIETKDNPKPYEGVFEIIRDGCKCFAKSKQILTMALESKTEKLPSYKKDYYKKLIKICALNSLFFIKLQKVITNEMKMKEERGSDYVASVNSIFMNYDVHSHIPTFELR